MNSRDAEANRKNREDDATMDVRLNIFLILAFR